VPSSRGKALYLRSTMVV